MKAEKSKVLGPLPPEWPEDSLPDIQAMIAQSGSKIVVFDDDPTGTQTVYDASVLMDWSKDALESILREPEPLVYVTVNSRGLPLQEAQSLNRQVAANLREASAEVRRDFVVVSRSDSTLRGHYPGELAAIAEGLGRSFDGALLVPFFLEGGRFTIDDVHYVTEDDWLVPAAETEFARDAAFPRFFTSFRMTEYPRFRPRPE